MIDKDARVTVTIRNLDKATKAEVRMVASYLRTQAKTLESLTAKDQAWLVRRKEYAPLFRMSLMR